MMQFFNLPLPVQSLFLIFYTLLVFAEIYCIIACKTYKTQPGETLANVILFLFSLVNLTLLLDGFMYRTGGKLSAASEYIYKMPVAADIILAVLQLAAVCFFVCRMNFYRRSNITPMSIKQGADRLPTGLCCFDENGRQVLTNHCMENLCMEITNEPLFNASDFWKKLVLGEISPNCTVVKKGSEPIIILESGQVRSFSCKEIIHEKKKIFELTASDITEQYALSRQLMDYNAQLEDVKKRLLLFSENMADITREKEILNAKIRIHDSLGKALLAAKRFVETDDGSVSREEILQLWQNSISFLRGEAQQPQESNSLDELYEAAKIMGISVSVSGNVPYEDNRTMRFIMAGARESLTNAVHHAKATKLEICILSEKDYNIIEYLNNGSLPEGEIKEGGGLSSLRKSVESADGIMQIDCKDRFVLRLKIPKQGGVNFV
ncbi:MAG: hypothetical protein ACI4GY_00900 [Acutalibacteraceae bacterium]